MSEIKVCAMCGADLAVNKDNDCQEKVTDKPAAGICAPCKQKLFMQESKSLKEFLDYLDEPTLLVNSDGVVQAGNDAALKHMGKTHEEFAGSLGGEVMECINAGLPEGCGNTIHCKACTIRNSVTATFKTGKSVKSQPAYLSIYVEGAENRVKYTISTEKSGDLVFLKIDDYDGSV